MSDDAPHDTPPLTRRELRERERAAAAAAAAPGAVSADAPAAAAPDEENDGIDDLAPAEAASVESNPWAAPTQSTEPEGAAPTVEPAAPIAPVAPQADANPWAAPLIVAPPAPVAQQPAPPVAEPPAPDAAGDPPPPAFPIDAAETAAPASFDIDVPAPKTTTKRKRKGGFWRALLTGIGFGLLALIIGIAAVTVIVPRAFGATALTVETGSMRPTLPEGTLVVVRPKPIDDIRIGNVITYEPNPNDSKELITHRVTAITTGTDGSTVFTTQGDANNAPDAPVQSKQVVGVLWYSVPWFGWVNSFLGGGTGAASLILPGIAVLLLAYALYAIISSAVGSRKKKAQAAAEKAAAQGFPVE